MQPFYNPYAAGMPNPYVAPTGPYGNSPILNELHTHFPALLYDAGRFRGIQDVFQYVQGEMRGRFDTFSNNQYAYRTIAANRNNANNFTNQMPGRNMANFSTVYIQGALDTLFNNAMGIPAGFMDAILISPSLDQVERGSMVYQTIGPSESPCAICQDVIVIGNVVRKLRGCNHIFHIDCIDTWYQRSTQCPTCRHDIRDNATPVTETTSPQHMNS